MGGGGGGIVYRMYFVWRNSVQQQVSSLLHACKGAQLAGSKYHRQFEGGAMVVCC